MHAVALSLAHAAEEAGESQVSPYVFGVAAFVALVVLLIVAMMIKVER